MAYNYYIKHLCNSERFKEYCSIEMKKGAGVANLNISDLEKYRIPLPPQNEQKEIAKYLNSEIMKIEILTNKMNRAIELLNEYRATLISEVVTGKIDVRDEAIP
jgi:type I restriction enzyme, S subunit